MSKADCIYGWAVSLFALFVACRALAVMMEVR